MAGSISNEQDFTPNRFMPGTYPPSLSESNVSSKRSEADYPKIGQRIKGLLSKRSSFVNTPYLLNRISNRTSVADDNCSGDGRLGSFFKRRQEDVDVCEDSDPTWRKTPEATSQDETKDMVFVTDLSEEKLIQPNDVKQLVPSDPCMRDSRSSHQTGLLNEKKKTDARSDEEEFGYPLKSHFSYDSSIHTPSPTRFKPWTGLHRRSGSSTSILREKLKQQLDNTTKKFPARQLAYTGPWRRSSTETSRPRASTDSSSSDHPLPVVAVSHRPSLSSLSTSSTASSSKNSLSNSNSAKSTEAPILQQVHSRKPTLITFTPQSLPPTRPLPPPPDQIPSFTELSPVEFYREQKQLQDHVSLTQMASIELTPFSMQKVKPEFPAQTASRFDIQDYLISLLDFHNDPIIPLHLIDNLTTSGYDMWEMTFHHTPSSTQLKMEFITSLIKDFHLTPRQVEIIHETILSESYSNTVAIRNETTRQEHQLQKLSVVSKNHKIIKNHNKKPQLRNKPSIARDLARKVENERVAAQVYYGTLRKKISVLSLQRENFFNGDASSMGMAPIVTMLEGTTFGGDGDEMGDERGECEGQASLMRSLPLESTRHLVRALGRMKR